VSKQSLVKRVFRIVPLMILSVLAALAILEVVVRLTETGRLPERCPDPLLGVRSVPNALYEQMNEGYSRGHFNSFGLRDREIPYAKPENSKRVLILGDSFMEALQVEIDSGFPRQLQTFLGQALPWHNIKTVNAGRGGMGTAEEYLWYVTEGVKYHPDLVLLAFYVGNDFRDNSKKLTGQAVFKPYITFDADTFWVDASFTESRSYKLKTLFWPLFSHSVLAAETARRIETLRISKEKPDTALCPKDLGVFNIDRDSVWENAYVVTGRIVALLDEAVKRNSSALCMMIIPDSYQVNDTENDCVTGLDLRKPNDFLREIAEARGIPFFDLTDTLEQEYLRTGNCVYGFGENLGKGHWNESGHRFAAQIMASNQNFIRLLRWL
jgi:hypothetical protein